MVAVTDTLEISDSELSFSASRSAGPGGQNVNKVNTRVTLRFDVDATTALAPEQKARVRDRLATRVSKAGVLSVSAQRERSQAANRQAAIDRFVELLQDALEIPVERRPTKMPRRAHRRRLTTKRQRSELKRQRGQRFESE